MNKISASLVALLAIGITMMAAQTALAQSQVGGAVFGVQTGTVGAAVTKTIETSSNKQLTFILQASGGNFGSKFGLVSVSVDGTNFILVDNISLSTNTILAKNYSDSSLASTVAVNPALFPFVKIATSAGNTATTEKITYTLLR